MSDQTIVTGEGIWDCITTIRIPILEVIENVAEGLPGGKIAKIIISLPTTVGDLAFSIGKSDEYGSYTVFLRSLGEVATGLTVEQALYNATLFAVKAGYTFLSFTPAGLTTKVLIATGVGIFMVWKGSDWIHGTFDDISEITDFLFGDSELTWKDLWDTFFDSEYTTTGKISDTLSSFWDRFTDAVETSLQHTLLQFDPLVIDLDNDGLELTSYSDSGINFDLDGDGYTEQVGWISGGDVYLCIDKNNNGNIDDINELFGSTTETGFSILNDYDSNKDNVIDSNDTQFNLLRVWNDRDGDGVVDDGELIKNAA